MDVSQRKIDSSQHGISSAGVVPPRGVQAIYQACNSIYPDQPNPLQVTTMVKYWLGGPDPLDYISMFANEGEESRSIPQHWHYVSFGLSDLHGDGRVHDKPSGPDGPSGFGFELTFRLVREHGESRPPTWPASLMQAFARYIFQSGCTGQVRPAPLVLTCYCNDRRQYYLVWLPRLLGRETCVQAGDHVSWHQSLNGSDSRLQHMLLSEDPQLPSSPTPFGSVTYLQEVKAAQQWNGPGVLELLRSVPRAAGPWLITDMRRGESVFEMDPRLQDRLDLGVQQEGSNLSGVSGYVHWEEDLWEATSASASASAAHTDHPGIEETGEEKPRISDRDSEQIKDMLQKGLTQSAGVGAGPAHGIGPGGGMAGPCDSTSREVPHELVPVKHCRGVHLQFNTETGSLLLLALRGRLKHGRHFTFMNSQTQVVVTLVSPAVVGTMVEQNTPFASHGPWLQVLLSEDFLDTISDELECLSELDKVELPKYFSWPDKKLKLTIVNDSSSSP